MLFIKASEACLSWGDILLTHPSAPAWKQSPIAKAHGWLTTFPIAPCHFRAVQGQELFPAHKGQLSFGMKFWLGVELAGCGSTSTSSCSWERLGITAVNLCLTPVVPDASCASPLATNIKTFFCSASFVFMYSWKA